MRKFFFFMSITFDRGSNVLTMHLCNPYTSLRISLRYIFLFSRLVALYKHRMKSSRLLYSCKFSMGNNDINARTSSLRVREISVRKEMLEIYIDFNSFFPMRAIHAVYFSYYVRHSGLD